LAEQALQRAGELVVLLGVPLDRGDGHPQDAAALAGDRLEPRRAAVDGPGADDLAGREPAQGPVPDPGLDALGGRRHDVIDGLARADQDVAGLQVGPPAEPRQLGEAAPGQREERQLVEPRLVGRELDRATLQPEPPDGRCQVGGGQGGRGRLPGVRTTPDLRCTNEHRPPESGTERPELT